MKYSGIGGQAVMEGVMMRNGEKYAVAVRKPDKEIVIDVKNTKNIIPPNINNASSGPAKAPILKPPKSIYIP